MSTTRVGLSDALPGDSRIVIGPDGTVLAATGDQLSKLVDMRLQECEALPREIREAGTALAGRLRDSGSRVSAQTIAPSGAASVQLVAIEAVAVRRAATDLRALLSSKLSVISSQAASVDVTLSVEVADEVPAVVRLDSEKVAWAVTTLVGNALRYLRAGSRRKPGAIGVTTTYERASSEVVIEVKDNGPGILPIRSPGCSSATAWMFEARVLRCRSSRTSWRHMADASPSAAARIR